MTGASDDHFRVLDRLLRRTDVNANGARLVLGGYGRLTQCKNANREHERTHRPPPARGYAPIPQFINCGEEWNAMRVEGGRAGLRTRRGGISMAGVQRESCRCR